MEEDGKLVQVNGGVEFFLWRGRRAAGGGGGFGCRRGTRGAMFLDKSKVSVDAAKRERKREAEERDEDPQPCRYR
jgi:hypothetical protein